MGNCNTINNMQSIDVYICASNRDQGSVNAITQELQSQGLTFYANILDIEEYNPSISVNIINKSKVFLFLASQHSYMHPWTEKELVYAFNHIPVENIFVYIINESKLPENISFMTLNSNVYCSPNNYDVLNEFQLADEKLIKRICQLLGREYRVIDTPQSFNFKRMSLLRKIAYAFISYGALGGAIYLAFYYNSLIFGICLFLGVSVIVTILLFWHIIRRRFVYSNAIGKFLFLIKNFLVMCMALALPFSIWLGIRHNSWITGILCYFCSIIVLVVLYNSKAKWSSFIPTTKREPLTNRQRSKNTVDFYVCYDTQDEKVVETIMTELKRNGISYITNKDESIEECIKRSKGFLYIASKNSYGNIDCNRELRFGFKRRRPILAYVIDETEMPEDKQMVFSNSNWRTIKTHPIETTLMKDLKDILFKYYKLGFFVINAQFLYTTLLTLCYIIALGCTAFSCYQLSSYSLGVVFLLCLTAGSTSINQAQKRRKKYTNKIATELMLMDCLYILMIFLLSNTLWWLLHPNAWMVVLLGFFVFMLVSVFDDGIYTNVSKKNPVGRLSPNMIDNYFDVFISYSRKDTLKANQICDLLQKGGFSYFIDRQGIPGGAEFPTILADGIRNCGIFLFLESEYSINSNFCQQERKYAEENKNEKDLLVFNLNFDRIDDWENHLVYTLKDKIPNTIRYKSNQLQKQRRSSVRMVSKVIKENSITLTFISFFFLALVFGSIFHSFAIGVGILIFGTPIPLYYSCHDRTESLLMSVILFPIWLGLITNSFWIGVVGGIGLVVLLFVVAIFVEDDNDDDEGEEDEQSQEQ